MKLQSVVILIILINNTIYAQDSTYYIPAYNKSDDSLKYELNQIIRNHTEFEYTSSSTDVWDILKETDRDTANSDNVILIYSGRSVNAAQEYNSGSGWSREHVWAKSRGDLDTDDEGPGTDVHHLRPCDISVNTSRNNRNFDTCITCVDVIDNGFNTGSKRDANLWTFEPPDEVKGDVARMIFYMAVRYEGNGSEPDLELTNTLLSNTDHSPLQARLSTLLHWNRIDSVSDWERNRNDLIDSLYQHNRNPFIDHPELVEHLWGDRIAVVWVPAQINSLDDIAYIEEQVTIYPNPTNDIITVKGIFDRLIIYNSHGQIVIVGNDNSYDLSESPSGMYFVRIIRMDGVSFTSTLVKE